MFVRIVKCGTGFASVTTRTSKRKFYVFMKAVSHPTDNLRKDVRDKLGKAQIDLTLPEIIRSCKTEYNSSLFCFDSLRNYYLCLISLCSGNS